MYNAQKIFPVIDLGDYILREKQDKDVVDFYEYYSDPEVNKFILSEIPRNLEEAKRELYYWRNIFYSNEGAYFAIAKKNDDKMIGSIGLTTYSAYHSRIELSYDMGKEYWRQGIMSKAIKAIVAYGFNVWHVNRIEAIASTFNEPSIRLLEKSGFIYEGCLRQHRYHKGRYVDVYSFSFLRQDFLKSS